MLSEQQRIVELIPLLTEACERPLPARGMDDNGSSRPNDPSAGVKQPKLEITVFAIGATETRIEAADPLQPFALDENVARRKRCPLQALNVCLGISRCIGERHDRPTTHGIGTFLERLHPGVQPARIRNGVVIGKGDHLTTARPPAGVPSGAGAALLNHEVAQVRIGV
jgi:hypothetical protein